VFRTEKGKQLPVYTDYRNGRTRCMTIVRRIRGDEAQLADEMSRVCDNMPVAVRPGRIEVKGNYRGRVTEWLQRLGF
jgi:large subunit ribosomal protein L49